ncbi:UNVERIFIED_CONTAM: hypothetical protein Slati_4126600 [Sesamum latifolium]|uniref:Uncharacterized protein n=1 Tax=Sesamum latifolium TaxID=2727402 RepID=A0AAW2T8T6_9LAMI
MGVLVGDDGFYLSEPEAGFGGSGGDLRELARQRGLGAEEEQGDGFGAKEKKGGRMADGEFGGWGGG